MHATPAGRPPFYRSLYFQVVTAIVIGVLVGHFFPQTGEALKPLGDGFIKLIKMIIAPIIFCTVVVGIAGMEDMKRVGKTGGYALARPASEISLWDVARAIDGGEPRANDASATSCHKRAWANVAKLATAPKPSLRAYALISRASVAAADTSFCFSAAESASS